MSEETGTLQNILTAGKSEFLEKGFKSASLRNIVKNAGVTTGAFYGYFSGKEALFAALVEEHAAMIMKIFMTAQENFVKIPKEKQAEHMGVESKQSMVNILEYIYTHYDEVKLLLCKAEGTAYESFLHNMVVIEVEKTFDFINVLKATGRSVPKIEPEVCHMIVSGMFSGMFELIVHDMPKENAEKYLSQFQDFYIAGWGKMLGI